MPDLDFISKVVSIILIDLVLSGDNAVVIGMAAQWTGVERAVRSLLLTAPTRRLATYGATAALLLVVFPVTAPAFIYFEF